MFSIMYLVLQGDPFQAIEFWQLWRPLRCRKGTFYVIKALLKTNREICLALANGTGFIAIFFMNGKHCGGRGHIF